MDSDEVRIAAIKKLTNQDALKKFALNNPESCVRRAAVYKLTDQEILKEIASNDVEHCVRMAAAKLLYSKKFNG